MNIILVIVIILLLAKLLGGLSKKLGLVELLGAVIAGIIVGPLTGWIEITQVEPFGKIGLILILFMVGFEFNLKEIKKEKTGILTTGILGGLIPFGAGWLLGTLFSMSLAESLFIGCIFAATSVSIAVGTLINAQKINTRIGRYVITSSIIDDIVGLFLLIFIASYVTTQSISLSQIGLLFGKIGISIVGALIFFYLIPIIFKKLTSLKADEIEISLALVFILYLAFLSEKIGFSAIIGAFIAGIVLSRIGKLKESVNIAKFEAISFGLFSPFFFAWVGMQLTISASLFSIFTLVFVLVAIASKIIAASISGHVAKMTWKERLTLGIARMARGEVALSVLLIGVSLGIISDTVFSSTLMLILITVFLTPLLLKPMLRNVN